MAQPMAIAICHAQQMVFQQTTTVLVKTCYACMYSSKARDIVCSMGHTLSLLAWFLVTDLVIYIMRHGRQGPLAMVKSRLPRFC